MLCQRSAYERSEFLIFCIGVGERTELTSCYLQHCSL
uniref:Uncharacterized protein n=1 Tax=Arundo donax TaxID=35708 RepID=A0A0A9B2J9_ARUDO